MKINVDNDYTLGKVQEAFSRLFPFLKIEFYARGHAEGKGSLKKDILSRELPLGYFRRDGCKCSIDINGQMKVAELERAFAVNFGLPTQVFRKSGSSWLQTITTDYWTLAQQNHTAMKKTVRKVNSFRELDYQEQA